MGVTEEAVNAPLGAPPTQLVEGTVLTVITGNTGVLVIVVVTGIDLQKRSSRSTTAV